MNRITRTPAVLISLLIACLSGLLLLLIQPGSAAALSCVAPEQMLTEYVEMPEFTVALVTAGEIETQGDTHDQTITTKLVYKGELEKNITVSFSYNESWQYMCSNGPAPAGEEALYILHENNVMQVYSPDSEFAVDLVAQLPEPTAAATSTPETSGDSAEQSDTLTNLKQQIIKLLEKLIALLSD